VKLLSTADLHFRIDWFRWLIEQAPRYDLVCIAGDLLDMFGVESTKEQAREVGRLIREATASGGKCEGNPEDLILNSVGAGIKIAIANSRSKIILPNAAAATI
jgi:Icc-related predicted phosphoesterase